MSEVEVVEVPQTDPNEITQEMLRARYDLLCKEVAEMNEKLKPFKEELAAAAARAEMARVAAMEISQKISEIRGGLAWFAKKKEIGRLARALGGY